MSQIAAVSDWITQVSHRAMATEFAVLLPAACQRGVDAAVEVLDRLQGLERRWTIFRDDSEIARVNRQAADREVSLAPASYAVIEQSLEWSRRTEGAFDITAGPLVDAWGFTRRSGRKPTPTEIEAALASVGYRHLRLAAHPPSIRFLRPGMAINLGAIGKGAALDELAAQLRSRGQEHFLIHGGNSSVLAMGDQQPGSGTGWKVGIAHPSKPRRRLGGIWLRNAALSTSGSGKQFFHYRGRRYGHVIDPRSGYPAGDLMSLTVVCPSAADADACATGLFVMGSEAMQQKQREPWFPSVIAVKQGVRQDQVEVATMGELAWVED